MELAGTPLNPNKKLKQKYGVHTKLKRCNFKSHSKAF